MVGGKEAFAKIRLLHPADPQRWLPKEDYHKLESDF